MIKTLYILILSILNLNSNEFKRERTYYYSPLSYTVNYLEKTKISQKKLSPQIFKTRIQKLEKLKSASKNNNLRFKINPFNGSVSLLSGNINTKKYPGKLDDASKQFLEENKEILDIDTSSLKKVSESNIFGTSHIYYIQKYNGLDVEFSYVKIHRNQKNEITLYNSRYYKDIIIDTNPKISLDFAISVIKQELDDFKIVDSTMVIYPDDLNDRFYLAYKIEGYGGSGIKNGNWLYYIDAHSGKILFKYDKRQYACQVAEETTGTINAYVYEISPIPTGNPNGNWQNPTLVPLSDLSVFVGSYERSTTTKDNGEYCFDYSDTGAKVFFTTLGPYFSVMDYNGNNIFFTNANYQIRSTSLNSTLLINSYPPNSKIVRTITPTLTINSGETLAFISPYFSSFNIGSIDEYGNSNDGDYIYITHPNGDRISAFVGSGKSNFTGGWIPSSSYTVVLVSDESGNGNFSITASTYIVLTDPIGNNNNTGSFNISTSALTNVFYHLNKVRNFFMKFNSKCSPNSPNNYCIDLNKRVPVMVNVYAGSSPMYNAFYDLRQDAIYIGRGSGDKNFAWDGTVIRHEYVHLVMNRIYPIIYFGEFGAITEALADYFSLSSFWDEGKTITIVGNFLNTSGEGAARDLASISKKMPQDWKGEVHEDGQILSAVFYKLAKGGQEYNLGEFNSGIFSGLKKSDVYIFGAMFYFPDSFESFMEAMIDLCKNIEGSSCDDSKIRNAFATHAIISDYIIVDNYEPNNGPSYAVDITTLQKVKAYIDYPGDEDYYLVSAGVGFLHLKLQLPKHPIGLYHAYTLFLLDFYGNPLAYQMPPTNSSFCYNSKNPEYSENCLTRKAENEFYYYISTPGVYYVLVTAGLNEDMGPGRDYNRENPYLLSYDSKINTSLKIQKILSKIDEDEFEFSVNIPRFYYNKALSKPWQYGQVFEFCEKDCIEMFDNRMVNLSTDYINVTDINGLSGNSANYYSVDSEGNYLIKGKIKFQKDSFQRTFSQRYPYVGTVYFKIKAKNHMFEVGKNKDDNYITLAFSNPVYLTGSTNDIITYNNIIDKTNKDILIKVETKETSNININVYTSSGLKVKKIYSGIISGKMSFTWDGTDENGRKLPSGIYYIKTEGAVNKVEKVGIVR